MMFSSRNCGRIDSTSIPSTPKSKAELTWTSLPPCSSTSRSRAPRMRSCATWPKRCCTRDQTIFHEQPSNLDQSPVALGRWRVRSLMSDCNARLNGRSTPAPNDRWLVLLLLGLGLPIFLLGLGSPALYDPHESLYAEIAREMVVGGD